MNNYNYSKTFNTKVMNFNCFLLIIQFLMFPICFGRLEEDTSYNNTTNEVCDFNKCFHKSVDFCPSAESPCRCHQLPKCRRAVVCCNVNSFQMKEGLACANVSDGVVEALHIRNATLDELNVSLPIWKRLRYMTISDGNIRSVIGEFSKLTFMSCLNLSSNSISKFDERSLVMLYNLSYLDLSNNNLTEIPRFKKEGPVTLDISHNDYIQCSSVTETLKRAELFFNNGNKTTCTSPKTFYWFNSTEHVPLIQIKGLQELNDECSRLKYNCSCAPLRLDIIIGTGSIYAIEVNCSNRGLTKLPSVLPPNTVSLNVRNNNITSLEAINNNPSYSHLRQLYADNNEIESVLPLEGSDFLYQFITLNLSNNKIKSIPIYLFSNALDRNGFSRFVFLGFNYVHCDCYTAKVLKVWLLTKKKQIGDYEDIYCENMNSRVMDLNSSKLCQSASDWTDYVCYIITFQVLLLVGLIAKVFYDYWIFKTAGYLPWPASKMPKMPCDWLCE